MSGQPVTLGTLTEAVNERLTELKMKERSGLRKLIAVPFVLLGRFIGALARIIGPLARIGIGLLLLAVTLPALVCLTIGTGFLFSSDFLLVEGLTFQSLMPGMLHWFLPLSFFAAALIPALFVLFAGISLLRRKSAIPGAAALGLLGIWVIALACSGFGVAEMAAGYQDFVRTSPAYKTVATTLPLDGGFDAVSVEGLQLRIERATSTRLVAEGRARDMATIGARIENGTLMLERNRIERDGEFCLFCSTSQPTLTLYTDSLTDITADDASVTSHDLPAGDTVRIALDQHAYADISLETHALAATLNDGSYLSLDGSLGSLEAVIDRRSRLSADALDAGAAALTLDHDSSAEINASDTLTVGAKRGSYVRSSGDAAITQDVDESSTLYAE
jgi:hypothetical protein